MHGTCAIFGCERGSEILAHGGVLGGHDICGNTARAVSAKKQTIAALKLKISAKAADKKAAVSRSAG